MLNVTLWGLQGFLALFFLAAGVPKLANRGIEQWTGFTDLARPLVIVIGVAEVLAAIGLVLPMATDIAPWLTPMSAGGLAVIVLMASGFHLRADERLAAVETALWAALATIIAFGRWDLVTVERAAVPSGALVTAVAILVPATLVNIVVLWRRSATDRAGELAMAAEG